MTLASTAPTVAHGEKADEGDMASTSEMKTVPGTVTAAPGAEFSAMLGCVDVSVGCVAEPEAGTAPAPPASDASVLMYHEPHVDA